MNKTMQAEVARLEKMSVNQLAQRFEEVFGEECRSRHKRYLIRRIAWRLQANTEGGLSERARQRAEELADDAEIRVTPPRTKKKEKARDAPQTIKMDAGRDPTKASSLKTSRRCEGDITSRSHTNWPTGDCIDISTCVLLARGCCCPTVHLGLTIFSATASEIQGNTKPTNLPPVF